MYDGGGVFGEEVIIKFLCGPCIVYVAPLPFLISAMKALLVTKQIVYHN